MNTTTRISDLPENITMQISNNNNMQQNMMINGGGEKKFDPNINTNYVPINVHPNPYGISEQNPIMPLPQHQQPPNVQQMQQMQQLEQLSVGQQQQMQQAQQQALHLARPKQTIQAVMMMMMTDAAADDDDTTMMMIR
jgi:hypothetical protein